MLMKLKDLVKRIQEEPCAGEVSTKEDFWGFLADWIEEHVLSEFPDQGHLRPGYSMVATPSI